MSAADENQVLTQAEIDAMLGNAAAGSELDDPLTATAPPVAAGAAPEPATVVWSTASPETPLVPSTSPPTEDEPARAPEPPEQKGGRRGLFGKILGKPSGPAAQEAPAAPPPSQSAATPPAPARPRPALDIEDDLAAAGTDELDATPAGAALPEPEGTPTATPLDAVEGVMSVFLEHEGMDPMLRRLVERVPDVSVEELLTELREICGLLGIEPQQREERAA
ncbi:MAG TPA: hypothetical protein VNM43_05920 [Dehalococcoidia bacterium]|nr:hypothetical protein [Dehalococcoidia bacterium]